MKRFLFVVVCILLAGDLIFAHDAAGEVSEIEELKQKFFDLEQKLELLQPDRNFSEQPETTSEVGGRFQQLPDISFILQAKSKFADDKVDPEKQKLKLTDAELALQSYVYPNVRLDAFIAGSPAESGHSHFGIHEAFITYLALIRNLNVVIGQKFVPFGRVNQLHNHSWLYARQPLALSNLVAPESLAGQGILFDYNLPISDELFARLDVGFWANGSEGEESSLPNIMVGPGAGLTDRFRTIRLWLAKSVGEMAELEAGWSWAGGRSEEDAATLARNYVHLGGLDLSYRKFGTGARRLLLRAEYIWRKGTLDSDGARAKGYYLFADYRWNRYNSIGLLYDWSEFPQDVSRHESAASLILTRQFSEQYYVRLQATHGSRPNADSYDELWVHWAWGIGPHTHNLE